MTLYKNVDIKDLRSILENGILPISETGNNNWEDGHRVNNPTDVVYLFKALERGDSFVNYGLALIEVECEATINNMSESDINRGKYTEYICKSVLPCQIKNIYIPEFVNIDVTDSKIKKVTYSCDCYNQNFDLVKMQGRIKEQFEKTAKTSTSDYNYLRGFENNGIVIDAYNWKYNF